MVIYADGVVLINSLVDLLLILGTNRLTGHPMRGFRAVSAALAGGIYGGLCLLPGFGFLGGTFWHLVSLVLMAGIAFGCQRHFLQRTLIFVLLSMALGGIVLGLGEGSLGMLLLAVGVLLLVCFLCTGQVRRRDFSRLELRLGERVWRITALQDTGNLLTDPVTGQSVTVVGYRIAREMLGLSEDALANPVGILEKGEHPGLRLIPYRSLGQRCGLLAALPLDEVRIDGKTAGRLVAFSPELRGQEGFEALTGGTV